MAQVDVEEVFQVPIEKVYSVLTDYEAYPEYVEGTDEAQVLDFDDNGARVKFSLNIIKKFSYILKMTHQKPNKISWLLESGDLFKKNTGFWDLSDNGDGSTSIKYGLDLDFKMMVPKMIINKLVKKNFPAMMENYHQRCKQA
jgi:coenzyme Q-binding protein COQ10